MAIKGSKGYDWAENWVNLDTEISVLAEIDGFLVWCFKVVTKIYPCPGYFCGKFKWTIKLNYINTR